jgi:hypothetical protein
MSGISEMMLDGTLCCCCGIFLTASNVDIDDLDVDDRPVYCIDCKEASDSEGEAEC